MARKREINPTIRVLLIFIGILIVVALSYSKIEGISFFDAIYWVITTCSTVGYGDISPKTMLAKVITMFLMVSGVALLGYLLSTMSDKLISFNMSKMMGLSRVKTSGHVILMGWNVVGRMALEELRKMGAEVVVVDSVQHPEIAGMTDAHFVIGSYQDSSILKKAGIESAAAVILAMESDSEVIIAISFIREINAGMTIVARIDDLDFADVALQAGCNHVVSPSEIGGNLLFSALTEPAVLHWFSEATVMNCGVGFIDIDASRAGLIGKTVGAYTQNEKTVVAAIYKPKQKRTEELPDDDVVIEENDILIAIVKEALSTELVFNAGAAERMLDGDVLLVGWNPTVRSAVNELTFAKKYKLAVLSDEVPPSEKDYYEQLGVTFIPKDISKLSLKRTIRAHHENVIVGIEDDSDAILSSHIIRGLDRNVNLIVRVDDPANDAAAKPIGADQIVSPSVIGGHLLAHAIVHPHSVKLLLEATTSTVGVDVSQYTIATGDIWCGLPVDKFTYDKRFVVVGVENKEGGRLLTMPAREEVMQAGDTIVFLHL